MSRQRYIVLFQVAFIVVAGWQLYDFAQSDRLTVEEGEQQVVDSNDVTYAFDAPPQRVALTNTYAATVMKMLDVDPEVVVGVSGDFDDNDLWPEFADATRVQNSAHSEIDFEALLDARPDVYIVFATNGMVDTEAIRHKLTPCLLYTSPSPRDY